MSFNALTRDFTARTAAIVGSDAQYFNAADLRRMRFWTAIANLRRLNVDRLVIAIENEAGRALITPLSIAAAFTRARKIQVVWPDLRVEDLSRARALGGLALLLRDNVRARRALSRCRKALGRMAQGASSRSVAPARGRRILYIDANISLGVGVGGSIGHTAGVIDGFVGHGFSVDYASAKPVPSRRPEASWLRLTPQTLLAVPAELNNYAYADQLEATLTGLQGERSWSFIYQRFSLHNASAPLLARSLNVPAVVEFNASEIANARLWGEPVAMESEAQAAEEAALRGADLVVTVADALVEDLRRIGVKDERILVYPNCIDPEAFDPARFTDAETKALRDRLGIARDALVIGFIGTFGQWHGVDFLAERIAELAQQERDWLDRHRVRFMLVGDGAKMPMVREILSPPAVASYVTLTGLVPQDEAPRYLACADLLVSPHTPNRDNTEFFGSPTKLFEYMAMERPILASALGQIADVISGRGATRYTQLPSGLGQGCGLLFEPCDAVGFKQGLRKLVEDPGLGAALARAARREVLARYTWTHHVSAILNRMVELGLLEAYASQSSPAQREEGRMG